MQQLSIQILWKCSLRFWQPVLVVGDPAHGPEVETRWPLRSFSTQVILWFSDMGRTSLRTMRKDFRALGWQVKGSGAQVVFSSIPPVIGNDGSLNRMDQRINTWLWAWCAQQGFGFFGLCSIYKRPGLLATSTSSFSHRWKGTLWWELGRFIDKALKSVWRGVEGVTGVQCL